MWDSTAVPIGLGLVLAASAFPARGAAVEETRYGQACMRLENRPGPQSQKDANARRSRELGFAEAGFQARWISVVDPLGCAEYASEFVPSITPDVAENEQILRDWVKDIHDAGMPVMSWYPLVICKSGAAEHPEWRQQFIVPEPEGHCKGNTCCINSPYGQAVIDFCNEAIDRFGLDGFWFDGSAFTQIWDRPLPLSCTCPYCADAFREATGLELPTAVDWNDAAFCRWVAWRYRMFGDYIGRLAAGIREKHPDAAVVINHYHRPIIPWQGSIPLNPYAADIITGSEASGPDRVDTTMRLCRAYGRAQCEVWRPFDTPAGDPANAPETDALIHHALSCFVAGGMPSFGGGGETTVETAALMAPILEAIHPFVSGPSVRQAALHLSQQTETFYLSRHPKGIDWQLEPFWGTIEAWTQALGAVHTPPDYVYDANLTPEGLTGYQALAMPMSLALSEAQVDAVLAFARDGGTVILGPGAGALDEWGGAEPANRLARELGITFGAVPDIRMGPTSVTRLVPAAGGQPVTAHGFRTPLALAGDGWQALYSEGAQTLVATRPEGNGRVVVLGTDLGGRLGAFQPAADGDTSLAVTDEQASEGAHSLRFADGAEAAQTFYPDMECRFPAIAAPDRPGGRVSFDLMVDAASEARVELRNSAPPIGGPSVAIGPRGKVSAGGLDQGSVPLDTWVHLEVRFRFGGDEPASFDLTITPRGGEPTVYASLPVGEPAWSRLNWMVIFGGGTQPATFYVDDVRVLPGLEGDTPPAFADDFESTQVGGTAPEQTYASLAATLKGLFAPTLDVEAPETVRAGYFERDGKVLVHLHNRLGTHRGFGQPVGPAATIVSRSPVAKATLAISGQELAVARRGDAWTVDVPHVGLYEVVALER